MDLGKGSRAVLDLEQAIQDGPGLGGGAVQVPEARAAQAKLAAGPSTTGGRSRRGAMRI